MNGKLLGARIWLSGSFPEGAQPDEQLRYLRIDSVTQYDALDDLSNTKHFINLGEEAAKDAVTVAKVQALFLDPGPARPW